MSLYVCSKCNAVENTALAFYWWRMTEAHKAGVKFEPTCSECEPKIAKWHGQFPKTDANDGTWQTDERGFLQRVKSATKETP